MCLGWICATTFAIGAILALSDARFVHVQRSNVPQNSVTDVLQALQNDITKLQSIIENGADVMKTDEDHVNSNTVKALRSNVAKNLQYLTRYKHALGLLKKCGKALVLPYPTSTRNSQQSFSYKGCLKRLESALHELPSKTKFYVEPQNGKKSGPAFVDLTRSVEERFLLTNADGDQTQPRRYLDSIRNFRLPHFLPKRWHWVERDVPSLDTYWYHGPLGVQLIFR